MLSGFCPAQFGVLLCSVVLGCRYTPKTDRVVSGASFLTGGEFECNIAHCRSVAVLVMLYTIRCSPMHPLYGALAVWYLAVRVTRGALVAHWYTYAPPRSRSAQYCITIIHLSVTLWNDLDDLYSMVWDWRVSKSRDNASLLTYAARSLLVFHCFPFLLFLSIGRYCGAGSFH